MNTHGVSDSVQTLQCNTVFIRNGANEMVTLPEYVRYKVSMGIEIKNKPTVIIEDAVETVPVIQNIWNVSSPKTVCVRYVANGPEIYGIHVSISSTYMGQAQHYSFFLDSSVLVKHPPPPIGTRATQMAEPLMAEPDMTAAKGEEDLKLRVALRIRPMLPLEKDKNCQTSVKSLNKTQVALEAY